jgi:hypothetical protein
MEINIVHMSCLILPLPDTLIFRDQTEMSLSSASRQTLRRVAKRQCRSFSTTPTLGAAAEVKKLGVIGAGQMVYRPAVSVWDAN